MLDRLPVELVLRILRLADPLVWDSTASYDRPQVLAQCSLVNKRIHALAQPMLDEVFEARDDVDGEWLVSTKGGETRGSKVKVLVVLYERWKGDDDPLVPNPSHAALLASCPNLVELRMMRAFRFELDWVVNMPRLKTLIICGDQGMDLKVFPPTKPLSSLADISLCFVEYTAEFFQHFPTPSSAPSLRAFAVCSSYCGQDCKRITLAQLQPTILDQLDSLVLDPPPPRDDLTDMSSLPVLLDQHSTSMRPREILSHPYHRLGYWSYRVDYRQIARRLSALAKAMFTATSTSLRFLLLPSNFKPLRQTHADLDTAIKVLLRVAKLKGVEVAWEEKPDYDFDSLVSPVFSRRMRRLKMDQAEGRIEA
ncbi:hypothetical protein JCM8097_003972 [Rhodosporidiobolus ruineniae]